MYKCAMITQSRSQLFTNFYINFYNYQSSRSYIHTYIHTDSMLSPHEKQDKIIRATDLDALSCRHSANNKSYFSIKDPHIDKLVSSYQSHLQFCMGYTNLSSGRTLRSVFSEQKLPLINRGTYLRTESIDLIVNEFIKEFEKCQIISLGGGSDTRSFRVLDNCDKDVVYYEIDFPESVKIKKLAILNDTKLSEIVKYYEPTKIEVNSKEQFAQFESDLHTENYHLLGYDLRQLLNDQDSSNFLRQIDTSVPTLILSECVLCYVSPEENEKIISSWKTAFSSKSLVSFLIYEPMSLNDPFGSTMSLNLSNRGINLLTFNEYPNLESRYKFLFEKCGLSNVKLSDMSNVGGYDNSKNTDKAWLSADNLARINRLELIDEIEEIRLLLKHYCLCYGEFSDEGLSFNGINNWKWIIG